MSADDHTRKAANFAGRMDHWLICASSSELPTEARDAALYRAFKQFVGLLEQMRRLKAANPDAYAQAEAEALTAREIEGQGG